MASFLRRFVVAAAAVGLGTAVVPATQQSADRRLVRDNAAGNGRRLALVVGNDAYAAAPLKNARNDARAMADALREVGFTITMLVDAKRSDLGAALDAVSRDLTDRDTVLFYFAGHGLQIAGENYLVPVDFTGQTEAAVRYSAVPVTVVHETLRKARVSMIVLDACRTNPFAGTRATGGGLAPMQAQGSLIAFAADAGQTSSDNPSNGNGLFTTELLAALREPGLGVREVFRRAREHVVRATNGRQFPAVYDGLVGDFMFRESAANPPAAVTSGDNVARREEVALWESINQVKDANALRSMLQDYLRMYPSGRFAAFAQNRLADLSAPASTPSAPPSAPAAPPPGSVAPSKQMISVFAPDIRYRAQATGKGIQLLSRADEKVVWETTMDPIPWESRYGSEPNAEITTLMFSPDFLFSGDRVGRVCSLDWRTGKLRWCYHNESTTVVTSLRLSTDGRRLTVFFGGTLLLLDAATGARATER